MPHFVYYAECCILYIVLTVIMLNIIVLVRTPSKSLLHFPISHSKSRGSYANRLGQESLTEREGSVHLTSINNLV